MDYVGEHGELSTAELIGYQAKLKAILGSNVRIEADESVLKL